MTVEERKDLKRIARAAKHSWMRDYKALANANRWSNRRNARQAFEFARKHKQLATTGGGQ